MQVLQQQQQQQQQQQYISIIHCAEQRVYGMKPDKRHSSSSSSRYISNLCSAGQRA
jgi:hypothetical protein